MSRLALAVLVGGCAAAPAVATPAIVPGSTGAPREVNLITRDYSFVPTVLDLVPGETITLHVINGGLVVHEAILGDGSVQDAWEAAEAAVAGAPPGPTPVVTVPSEVAGLRVVVQSGERVDVTWTVPAGCRDGRKCGWRGQPVAPAWLVGCHIPGHLAKGMVIPIRWVLPGDRPSRRREPRAEHVRWYPLAPHRSPCAGASRRNCMTYVIAEPCIDVLDISCVSVCPVDCIHYDEGTDRKLFIDPNECIDCGACEPECPVNAIFPEESLPPEWAKFTVMDATWYTDKAAARAAVDEAKPA